MKVSISKAPDRGLGCNVWFVSFSLYQLDVELASHLVSPKRSRSESRRIDTFDMSGKSFCIFCPHEFREQAKAFCKLQDTRIHENALHVIVVIVYTTAPVAAGRYKIVSPLPLCPITTNQGSHRGA